MRYPLGVSLGQSGKRTKQEQMAKLERWGKKYNDKRNWPEYNKQLVRRGTLYLSLEFVEQWDQLVTQANRNKRGHPLIYPMLFIE
jgi:hypothetical protein